MLETRREIEDRFEIQIGLKPGRFENRSGGNRLVGKQVGVKTFSFYTELSWSNFLESRVVQ